MRRATANSRQGVRNEGWGFAIVNLRLSIEDLSS
jgi:hypothetical protein